jgi:hypothetical protein
MKKKLAFLLMVQFTLISILPLYAEAPNEDEIEVIAKIQSHGKHLQIIRSNEDDVIPSVLKNDSLKYIISSLLPGDEAVISGKIIYQASTVESQTTFKPIFMISSIRPISLKRLGSVQRNELNEQLGPAYAKSEVDHQKFISFPVTTEVASAITVTSAALLMSSLTASTSQPGTVQQLNGGLILFAGALATGVFIFEQIKGKVSK